MSLKTAALRFIAESLVGSALSQIGQHVGDAIGNRIGKRIDPDHGKYPIGDDEETEETETK